MPADYNVDQQAGVPSCLVTASMCLLEVMSHQDVLESSTAVFNEAVAAGLYAPNPNVPQQILDIMNFVGTRGVLCEGGRVYGAGPYPLEVAVMMEQLHAGMRPYCYWFPVDPQATHAVCALAVAGGYLITADQSGYNPSGAWSSPVAWAQDVGLGAFAYGSHSVAPA